MTFLQTKIAQKLLLTISAALISPLAQAHDNSQSTGLLAHIWAHSVEMANSNAGLTVGFLLMVAILVGLLTAAFYARLRTRTTAASHG